MIKINQEAAAKMINTCERDMHYAYEKMLTTLYNKYLFSCGYFDKKPQQLTGRMLSCTDFENSLPPKWWERMLNKTACSYMSEWQTYKRFWDKDKKAVTRLAVTLFNQDVTKARLDNELKDTEDKGTLNVWLSPYTIHLLNKKYAA